MKRNTSEDRLRILCQRSADNEPVELILPGADIGKHFGRGFERIRIF